MAGKCPSKYPYELFLLCFNVTANRTRAPLPFFVGEGALALRATKRCASKGNSADDYKIRKASDNAPQPRIKILTLRQ
jgi:hypothetical protein